MSASTDRDASRKIVVVGGGRAGEAILDLLTRDGRYDPFVCETDYDRLRTLRDAGYAGGQISGTDSHQMAMVLQDAACVICAVPPSVAPPLAAAALAAGCHYVDISEKAQGIADIAAKADAAVQQFAPGCGLAPGLVSAMVDMMIRQGPEGADITAYTGVLPTRKTNRLGYGDLWGIDGLMAEYTNPCLALQQGEVVTLPPLDMAEEVTVGNVRFEAFTTSGSLENMVRRYRGQVKGLVFKTLRYPGHLDYIRFLLDDLNLSDRPYMFRNLLMNGLPKIDRDRVIIHIVDHNPDHPRQMTRLFHATELADGHVRSAVSAVTAQHVCAVTDILVQKLAPPRALLHHGDLTLDLLGHSRFARALQLPDGPAQDII